ncbi:putative GNAT family acetyltransferase [Agromyces sp. 3263]|uniref:GNAT family N-acetyltransferase n=1 Tax=Agromyces sp. 3263 TaxID=2817750 RepID=UPI00285F14F9|nr:GNAT family N-acetyltransferase [Agromyces sp. 3263]MDR6905454.1 putative GNAT family acetyltransferase [Agromyces sp. 3263]
MVSSNREGRHDVGRVTSLMRRGYALLIGAAITLVVFHELTSLFTHDHTHGGGPGLIPELHSADLVWAAPAIAVGIGVGVSLVVASASQAGIAMLERFGLPGLGADARARANGLAWGAIAMLGVHFTGAAFDVVPGGHTVAAIGLGVVLCLGTARLHRVAIEHEAYRTFNLIAMLLAAGSLASMSLTPTGAWWTHNFSTLGTSDDVAAACFNIAIVVSGAGMAAMSGGLTRAVADVRFGVRRGGLTTMRVLIVLIGVSLMGVGLFPIDGDSTIHNAAALGAAVSFAVLAMGVQLWARRLPRTLVVASYASIVVEVAAMVAYDGLGVFNLTVFEIVAFTLVFAWLIALVAITHASPVATDAAAAPHLAARRPGGSHVPAHGGRRRIATVAHPGAGVGPASRPVPRPPATRPAPRRPDRRDRPPVPVGMPSSGLVDAPSPAGAGMRWGDERVVMSGRVARGIRRWPGLAMEERMQDTVKIERNDAAERYELTLDGERVGFAQYHATPGRIVFTHTVVEPEHEGQGLGSRLAKFVLDDAVARGDRIVPRCPFIAAYLREHPGYEASVDWPA